MRLRVLIPTEVLLDQETAKIKAEAPNGWFCLLPKHVDFATALVPGILSFQTVSGNEEFLAIDHGILVKCGAEVSVSTRGAVHSPDLATVSDAVKAQFSRLDEREKAARAFEAKLEADLVRRLMEAERHA